MKNQMQEPAKKKWIYDILLLGGLALLGLTIFLVFSSQKDPARNPEVSYYVQVEMNQRIEALISVEEDGEYPFTNLYTSGENILQVKDGGVSMKSATCPDQVCVHQGYIQPGTIIPIVCMPNYVYVSIVAENEIEWDKVRESIVPDSLYSQYEAYRNSHK